MSPIKFFLAVFWWILWPISSLLCIIFYITDYKDVLHLGNISYHNAIFLQQEINLKENHYNLLVILIRILSLFSTSIMLYSFISCNWIKQELNIIITEFSQVFRITIKLIKQLTKKEKIIALTILISIISVRIFYLKQYSFTTDEVASYDFFVLEGPLAVISFYPITNNHILSNLFSLLFYQINHDPLLTMRGPTFLVSLVGTILMYIVLIRYGGFAVATLSIGILSFSQVGIFYAIAGRGYFLLTVLGFISVFSMLPIMYKSERARLYWCLFIISSILGFYTVPTFIYLFASILAIGFCYFLVQKQLAKMYQIIASFFIIVFGTIILYLPLFLITTISTIIKIDYIQPLDNDIFWSGFPLYISYTEGYLVGQERLGKYFVVIILILSAVKFFYFKEKGIYLKIGLPALALVFIPYILMTLQQVYVPERALFYKTIYLYLLVSFLFFWLLRVIKIAHMYKPFLVGIILLMYGGYQLYHLEKQLALVRIKERQRKETFIWLKAFKPNNMLVLDPPYALYLNHYFKSAKINCKIYSEIKADMQYDFLIFSKDEKFQMDSVGLASSGKKVYQNNFVRVYDLKK